MDAFRTVCERCRRPTTVCYCAVLSPVPSRTRVVFLQHPRERRVAVGTCRMAHLSLPNSELHVGVDFSQNVRVQELASQPSGRTVVLFPGEGAVPVSELRYTPDQLVVVDGTWSQAQKVVHRNPLLWALPRVGLTPSRPGNYRIRREPAEHCLSTIEAVVEVLGILEQDPQRFQTLLRTFDRMVEYQLAHIHSREGESRHKRARHRQNPRKRRIPPELLDRYPHLVLVYAEANAHPSQSCPSNGQNEPAQGPAELVQWVAVRPSTGERFEALIAPRRPLSPSASRHLEVPAEALLEGETLESGLARWRHFLSEEAILVTWGRYPIDLLQAEGAALGPVIDLRQVVAQRDSRRPGGVEKAAQDLNPRPPRLWTRGRAARRIACVERVLEALLEELGQAGQKASEVA